MLSEVEGYCDGQPHQVAYSHYEISNEIYIRNINGKSFTCQRLHNTTNVKSSRVLGITEQQIIEMAVNPFKNGFGTVIEIHNLEGLSKIKFQKTTAGLLTLTFSSGHILLYIMADPIAFVDFLKVKMQQIGIRGDVTNNSTNARHIESATSFFDATRETEAQFSLNPSYKLIEKIMDLLREAAEQFAEASDDRYLRVIEHIQKFLQRADVTAILDFTLKNPAQEYSSSTKSAIPDAGYEINIKSKADAFKSESIVEDDSEAVTLAVDISPIVAREEGEGEGGSLGVNTTIDPVIIPHFPVSVIESPTMNLQSRHDTNHDDFEQEQTHDTTDLSKYEDELEALMMSPCGIIPNNENKGMTSVKSDDLECELKSMLGDITDEFANLMNSFEKTASDD